MIQSVAFLRGINVGGKNVVRMEDVRRVMTAAGFRNVATFKASGNVIFEAEEGERPDAVLSHLIGREVAVPIVTMRELEGIVRDNPFTGMKASDTMKLYVSFFAAVPLEFPPLPLWSPKKDVQVIGFGALHAYCLSHKVGINFGFPNELVEKRLRVPATTRDWNTVTGIVAGFAG